MVVRIVMDVLRLWNRGREGRWDYQRSFAYWFRDGKTFSCFVRLLEVGIGLKREELKQRRMSKVSKAKMSAKPTVMSM